MKARDKEAVIEAFRQGELKVLVSTTVIEVGVDVPQATVMVVEHAERYGLSQLHQLRGRVGRAGQQAYCYLISGARRGSPAMERLLTMAGTTDGFEIAEKDLELRGPGEYLGTRQSGVPDHTLAVMLRHPELLEEAMSSARRLLAGDPGLARKEHAHLRRSVMVQWGESLALTDAG